MAFYENRELSPGKILSSPGYEVDSSGKIPLSPGVEAGSPGKILSSPGLEVGSAPCSTLPEALPYGQDSGKIVYDSDDTLVNKKRPCLPHRRNRILLGVAIAILIIVAVVVGTVVGVLKKNESDDAPQSQAPGPKESPQNKNVTDPQNIQGSGSGIRDDSMLAVTGWRRENEFSVRLFYQDKDGYVRIVSMESNEQTWSAGKAIVKAKLGTPLGAATHNQSMYDQSVSGMRTHLFYLNDESILQQYVFEDGSEEGTSGPMNEMNVKVAKGSKIGAYWPSVAFQDPNNVLSEMRFNCTTDEKFKCWGKNTLDIVAHSESPIALVARERNNTGLQIYYQRESEKDLVNYAYIAKSGRWGSVHDYQRPIPPSAPVAVMVHPRGNNSQSLHIFVLYQDSPGTILYSKRDQNGWKKPESSGAFDQAKKGTSLACTNPSSWKEEAMRTADDMTRCFYVGKEGVVRQVRRTGGQWRDLGDIRSTKADDDE